MFQDEFLDRFLSLCHAAEEHKIPPRIGEANFESELKKSITELVQSKGGPLVRFLSLILDKLINLLVRPPVISGQVGELQFLRLAFESCVPYYRPRSEGDNALGSVRPSVRLSVCPFVCLCSPAGTV